jgi:hypothetical protein
MDGKSAVSDNPLDYLRMIAYVKRGVPACDSLAQIVASSLDVLVQDVDDIQGPRPQWLRGVPTVVLLPERNVLTGSAALRAAEELCASSLQAAQACSSSAGCSLQSSTPAAPRFADLFTCDVLPSADGRYQDGPREKKNDVSLEEAMRLRGV